jgi:tetratricopeptide (TPR) repeat protein
MYQIFDVALEDYDKVIAYSGSQSAGYENSGGQFLPALLAKARVLMIQGNWEEALNTAHRVLRKDADSVGALRIIVLYTLARENKPAVAVTRIRDLSDAMQQLEAGNAQLYHDVSQLCSRLSGKRPELLELSLRMVDNAITIAPENSSFLTEKAYQLTLLAEYGAASDLFNQASALDEGNVDALHGRIRCKILQAKYKEAEQELEFLNEITTIGANAELLYLNAILAWKLHDDMPKTLSLLDKSITTHLAKLETVRGGFPYFIAYNPDFVLAVVSEYMCHIATEARHHSDPPNPILKQVIGLLGTLVKLVPGLVSAQLELAKANFIMADFDAAERALNTCINLDQQFAPALMLRARIMLARDNHKACSQVLCSLLSFRLASYLYFPSPLSSRLLPFAACLLPLALLSPWP